MTLRRGRERKERFVLFPKLHLSKILRQGPSPLFPRHVSGNQLCLFPGSLSGCRFSSSQRSGRGRAACRGLCWPWQRTAGLHPEGLPAPSVSSGGSAQHPADAQEMLAEQRDTGSWESRRAVGSASRSREDARDAEKMPLKAARQAVWVLGSWGSADSGSPEAQGAKAHLCLTGTCCPGNSELKNPSRV